MTSSTVCVGHWGKNSHVFLFKLMFHNKNFLLEYGYSKHKVGTVSQDYRAMLKGNVEILECSSYYSDKIWMYLIAHVIFVHVFVKSTISTLMEHHLIIHSILLVCCLWCGDSVRKDLKVKYFPCCLLWQNLSELPFLGTKRCLYGFYWVHQVCSV